jgi:hypothetical protein
LLRIFHIIVIKTNNEVSGISGGRLSAPLYKKSILGSKEGLIMWFELG